MIDRRDFLKGLFGTGFFFVNSDSFFKMMAKLSVDKAETISASVFRMGSCRLSKCSAWEKLEAML